MTVKFKWKVLKLCNLIALFLLALAHCHISVMVYVYCITCVAEGELKNLTREELQEKKRKLKEKFDAEYDDKDGGKTYYDELKQEVDQQAQVPNEAYMIC